MLGRLGKNGAFGIPDYGEKMLPMGHKESQSEHFGKSGISQFAITWLLLVSMFTASELIELLGEEGVKGVVEGDFIMYTTVLYCNDAKQDWVHSFFCFRASIRLLLQRFPNKVQEIMFRSDGAGNFKCSSQVLAMIKLSEWMRVRIIEFNFTEVGNGKNYTDSVVQKQKLYIKEHLKADGSSARLAHEMADAAAAGQSASASSMSCDVAEITFDRPLEKGGAGEALEGIQGMYHFVYVYNSDGKFEGLRAHAHEGLGEGKLFTAQDCARMWKEEGLSKTLEPVLREATGGLERENDAQARLLRGEEHKLLDSEKSKCKRAQKAEKKASRESEAVAEQSAAMAATGLYFCTSCARPFQRKGAFEAHAQTCVLELESKREQSWFTKIRPVEELEGSTVQSSQRLLFEGGSGDASSCELLRIFCMIWPCTNVLIILMFCLIELPCSVTLFFVDC